MKIIETNIEGCLIIEPNIFLDERGSFLVSYNLEILEKLTGRIFNFIQDNQSISKKNVIRGLHAQAGDYAQTKLVRVIQGEVLDVAVDIRPSSPTFGKHVSVILNDINNRQLLVPRGFLHGFSVLSDTAIFSYKVDNYYNKDSEIGVCYNDLTLNIDWNIESNSVIIGKKDEELPTFNEFCISNNYLQSS